MPRSLQYPDFVGVYGVVCVVVCLFLMSGCCLLWCSGCVGVVIVVPSVTLVVGGVPLWVECDVSF